MKHLNRESVNIFYMKKTLDGWSDAVALPIRQSGFRNVKSDHGYVYMSIYTRNGEGSRKTKRHFAMMRSSNLTDWEEVFAWPITRARLQNY